MDRKLEITLLTHILLNKSSTNISLCIFVVCRLLILSSHTLTALMPLYSTVYLEINYLVHKVITAILSRCVTGSILTGCTGSIIMS